MSIVRKRKLSGSSENKEENISDNLPTERFSADKFRNDLANTDCDSLSLVKQLVKLSHDETIRQDVMLEYVNSGGSVMELIRILDPTSKDDLNSAIPVFYAIGFVLIKIQSCVPELKPVAQEEANYVLHSFITTINRMISMDSPKHRQSVLMLLNGMASLKSSLSKEVLSSIVITSNYVTQMAQPSAKKNPVRYYFIKFLLTMLSSDDFVLLKMVLGKKGWISSLLPGLKYDSCLTASMVLSTLKEDILENDKVTKSMKLTIFNTQAIQSLIELYEWKGPENIPLLNPYKKKNKIELEPSPSHKEMVITSLDALLNTLCCSRKYGVVFFDWTVGTSNKIYNNLLLTALECLPRPWEKKETGKLVIEILKSSPDVVKNVLKTYEQSLYPRESVQWTNIVEFITSLLKNLSPEKVLKHADKLTVQQLSQVTCNNCLPVSVLKKIVANGLTGPQSTFLVKFHTLRLINTMWSQLNVYRDFVTSHLCNNYTDDIKQYCDFINNYGLSKLPDVETLWSLWRQIFSLNSQQKQELSPSVDEYPELTIDKYLLNILDLLLTMSKYKVDVLDEYYLNYDQMLNDVEELRDIVSKNLLVDIKLKILFIMSGTDITGITPDSDLFESSVKALLAGCKNENTRSESVKSLNKIFLNTGLFDNDPREIMVWINTFITYPSATTNFLITFITRTLIDCYTNPLAFQSDDEDVIKSSEELTVQILESLMDDKYEKSQINITRMQTPFLSPLITHAQRLFLRKKQTKQELEPIQLLETDDKKLKKLNTLHVFLQEIIINLFHKQKDLARFVKKVKLYPSTLHKSTLEYLTNWLSGRRCCRRLIFSHSQTSDYSQLLIWLLNKDEILVEDILTDYNHNNAAESQTLFETVLFILSSAVEKKSKPWTVTKGLAIFQFLLKSSDKKLVETLYETFFTDSTIYNCFNVFDKSNDVSRFITELPKCTNSFTKVNSLDMKYCSDDLLRPYRIKLFKQLVDRMENNTLKLTTGLFGRMVKMLKLNVEDIHLLFSVLQKRKVNTMNNSSSFLLLTWLVQCAIDIQHETEEYIISAEMFRFLTTFYSFILCPPEKKLLNFRCEFEKVLRKYLKIVPNHIKVFPPGMVVEILEKSFDYSPATIDLAQTLLHNRKQRQSLYIYCTNKSTYPNQMFLLNLLDFIIENYINEEKLILKVYDSYKTMILYYITEVLKLDCNLKFLRRMIQNHMSESEILDLIDKIPRNAKMNLKLATELICRVQKKHKIVRRYLKLYLECIGSTAEDKNNDFDVLFECITKIITRVELSKISLVKIFKSGTWTQFARACLRYGLHSEPCKMSKGVKILSTLVKVMYSSNGEEEKVEDEMLEMDTNEVELSVSTLFQLTSSHSEFLNVMFSSSEIKYDLLTLLLTLTKKDLSVISEKHIPVYLAAYNATVSLSDQIILQLLFIYESNGVSFSKYKPLLWGDTAADHYSVMTSSTRTSLWRHVNSKNVLDKLDMTRMMKSITHFPIDRKLGVEQELKLDVTDIYDPAFLLPLFCDLLSPGADVFCHTFVYSGAFSYTLSALSCNCSSMRSLAALVLSRFYNHVQILQHSRQRKVWLQFMNLIRYGSEDLDKSPITSLVTTFMALATLDITKPLDDTHLPLIQFLISKHYIDVCKVPEFLPLFHSSSVGYRKHRHWILECLKWGVKQKADLKFVYKAQLPKFLMSFVNCDLCDDETKTKIIEVLSRSVKVDTSCVLLNEYGLLPWLNNVILSMSNDQTLVSSAIELLYIITKSLSNIQKKPVVQCYNTEILLSVQNICLKINNFTGIKTFHNILFVLKSCLLFFKTINQACSFEEQLISKVTEVGKIVLKCPKFCLFPSNSFFFMENEDSPVLLHETYKLWNNVLQLLSYCMKGGAKNFD